LDATAFCYRAFYALGQLTTSKGQPTNAVFGFVTMLQKILKNFSPPYMAACFDVSRISFRTEQFAEYKQQRPPMPDGLSSQIPFMKDIIRAYGIALFEKEGFEADDLIATLSRHAHTAGLAVTVISSDKDMLQLVDASTVVFSPYKDEGVTYNEKEVQERFGVTPGQISDFIALMGDTADNIPGVRGVGEKTAAVLIQTFGSAGEVVRRVDEIKQEKLRETIKSHADTIERNCKLTRLKSDVPVDFSLELLARREPDYDRLRNMFRELEFKKFLKELPIDNSRQIDETPDVRIQDAAMEEYTAHSGPVVVGFLRFPAITLAWGDKVFCLEKIGLRAKKLLEDPAVPKIGHDLKRIKRLLAEQEIDFAGIEFDTMIAAYLLNPAAGSYDLSDIAWTYLEKTVEAGLLDSAGCARIIIALVPLLREKLAEVSLDKLFVEVEMPLVGILADMEIAGITLDQDAFRRLSRDVEERLITRIEQIYAVSGTQFNINSPKQLREILFEKLKLPVIKKSKTGPSTDEEVLNTLASQHELPALLLEYRHLTKLKSTYIDTLPTMVEEKTGRLHAHFNQTGTETGRLSSSDPNLQNIPVRTDIGRKIRQAIIASDKNHWLIAADYSQIELRILAHLSGDETLTKAFLQNKDIHKATAARIYDVQESDVTDQMRTVAKRVNFGIIYGLTSYGLARDLGISPHQAQQFIDAYFLRYPGVSIYIQKQIEEVRQQGFVTTILGRRRYIPEINNKNQSIRQFAERQAVNTPVQGSASDLIKLAMVKLSRDFKEKNLRTQMTMQIHDELVFDVPVGELESCVSCIRECMEHVVSLNVPIRVDILKGKNWLDME